MTLQLTTVSGSISIISVYAPPVTVSDDLKDSFHDELRTVIHKILTTQCIHILGDFNAWVGPGPCLLALPVQTPWS